VYQMHVHKLNVDLSVYSEATYTEWTYFSWVGTSPVTLDNPDGTSTTYVSLNPDEELITNINPVVFGVVQQLIFNPLNDLDSAASQAAAFCTAFKYNDVACLAFAMSLYSVNVSQILMEGNDTLFPTRTANEWLGIIPEKAPQSAMLRAANVYGRGLPSDTDSKFGLLYNSSKSTGEDALKDWGLQVRA